jgi:hypothetical protein
LQCLLPWRWSRGFSKTLISTQQTTWHHISMLLTLTRIAASQFKCHTG